MSLDFIIEMAWKSALISGVALLALRFLRARSPADRAAFLRLAVVLLLMLPVISLGLPNLVVERPAPVVAVTAAPAPVVEPEPANIAPTPLPVSTEAPPISAATWLLLAYASGVLLIALRLLMGLATLRRWTREARAVTAPAWAAALRRSQAGVKAARNVRLLVSDEAPAPLSWGLRSPVILIDPDTLARPRDAEAVVAHELAHVVRRDWLMLMLSRLAVALFWFNPLVWLLERALVRHAEEAADLRAVNRLEPEIYARTLVACGAHASGIALPANAIADGRDLARRVRAVLDDDRRRVASGSLWTTTAMVACVLVAAPIAALELVEAAPEAPLPPPAPLAPAAPQAPFAPAAPRVPALNAVSALVEEAAMLEAAPVQLASVEAAVQAAAVAGANSAVAARAATAVIDPDDLIAMRVHGIDAAYLAQLSALGGRFRRLDGDEIVAAKIHGLTPPQLRQYAEVGYGDIDIDELVAMKIHDVSPAYIRSLAEAGYRGLSPDDLVAMRLHGVSGADARRAVASGSRPSADELVQMKLRGRL